MLDLNYFIPNFDKDLKHDFDNLDLNMVYFQLGFQLNFDQFHLLESQLIVYLLFNQIFCRFLFHYLIRYDSFHYYHSPSKELEETFSMQQESKYLPFLLVVCYCNFVNFNPDTCLTYNVEMEFSSTAQQGFLYCQVYFQHLKENCFQKVHQISNSLFDCQFNSNL